MMNDIAMENDLAEKTGFDVAGLFVEGLLLSMDENQTTSLLQSAFVDIPEAGSSLSGNAVNA